MGNDYFTSPYVSWSMPSFWNWGGTSPTGLNNNNILPNFGNNLFTGFNNGININFGDDNLINPFSWMYSAYPLFQSFNNMDFMSIMLQQQQQSWLSGMYNRGMPMNIGMPNFDEIDELPVEELRQKSMSMPLTKECGPKIKEIAKNLNCNAEDLLGLIYVESGGNSKAVNRDTNATGLIQFMPSTAKWLGTSTKELLKMSPQKQLDYVENYLKVMKKSAGFKENEKLDAGKLYGLVFMPGRVKNGVLCKKGTIEYKQNRGLDVNGDGVINVADLYAKVKQYGSSAKKFLNIC